MGLIKLLTDVTQNNKIPKGCYYYKKNETLTKQNPERVI